MGDEFTARVSRRVPAFALAVALSGTAGCAARHVPEGRHVAAQNANLASANDGARVYIANCSSCHQIDGRGVPGAFPPLAGNPIVRGDPARLLRIVARGERGPVQIAGHAYNGEMPAWEGLLSREEIAAVVSYIRGAWRNNAPPVPENPVY